MSQNGPLRVCRSLASYDPGLSTFVVSIGVMVQGSFVVIVHHMEAIAHTRVTN